MKKINIFILICFSIVSLNAQNKTENSKKNKEKEYVIDSTRVSTIDKTIKTLYQVISGEKGEERNWGQFKFLFYKNAKLIPSGKSNEGNYMVRHMSPEDYIKGSGKWLVENGFYEKEIHRTVNTFGNMAHVFSTYESFHSKEDKMPFMRGINSIQLFHDGKRWWIINVFWKQESNDQPIPKKYLPKT